MKALIKHLYDHTGTETGAILYVLLSKHINKQQKNFIEEKLIQYAYKNLYPEEGLKIYIDADSDSPSITVIKNINNMQNKEITI